MDRPRLLRMLRISFSAGCGIVCLLLVVLWVRSYAQGDYLYWNFFRVRSVVIGSTHGRVMGYSDRFTIGRPGVGRFRFLDRDSFFFAFGPPFSGKQSINYPSRSPIIYGFRTFGVSHWLLVLISATLAVVPWLKRSWRFSLRTLLIITTFAALLLRAVVFAIR
jgi:hypothetical protein